VKPLLEVHVGEQSLRAFEELLAANLDALYRTALRLCDGRSADAEDLLQDAMLRAFEKRGSLRDPSAGRAWLFTTLVRTNLNRVRSTRRRAETLTTDFDDRQFEAALSEWSNEDPPEEWLDRLQSREEVRNAVQALDPELRTVVALADMEGFTQRETAAMLEIPEGTVASRLFRARRALRAQLAKRRDAAGRRVV
jgi:RNA polymerase sigma-70 factor, ECF subfamily